MGSINLLEARRNILMSQPHLATESANPLTFKTDISAPIKGGKIYFEPVQEGSGDPSPDNVRPISGWDGVELHINNTSLTIPFPQTIYGGYVDLVKGEVVEEYQKFVLDGVNRWLTAGISTSDSRGGIYVNYVEAYNYFNYGGLSGMTKPNSLISQWDWKSNRFSVNNSDPGDYAMLQLVGGYNPYIRLFIHKSQLGDISDKSHITDSMKAWLSDNPIEISYKPITPITHQLTDGLTHITLGQDISPMLNGRSSTGGYANSTATGIDGCKFVYFELGWPTEAFLQYSADISRRSEFVSDSRALINGTTTDAKLGEMVISTGSATDYDGDALVYLYISVPSDCTDLESKRAYLAEHPIKITYPKKSPVPYTIDMSNLKPVKGTNNVWSNANGNVEIKFWKH